MRPVPESISPLPRAVRWMIFFALTLLAVSVFVPRVAAAQRTQADLSEAEIEEVREAAITPPIRVDAYRKIIDSRVTRIQDLLPRRYAPGRREDFHDLMQQVKAISDELEDNLEDYDTGHHDIRKALPKLLDSIERWTSVLKQPPVDQEYEVARKLAIESVADLKEIASRLGPEQKAWFTEHPPAKDAASSQIEVPR